MTDTAPAPTADRIVRPMRPLPTGLKVVAWSQVWGAATGTVTAFSQLLAAYHARQEVVAEILAFIIVYYTISGGGALLLVRGHDFGLSLLKFALIPQLLYLQGFGFAYHLLSGFYALFGYDNGVLGFKVGVISSFGLHWDSVDRPPAISLNVLAMALLIYLNRNDPFRNPEPQPIPTPPDSQEGPQH